ncbi:hypothetical protein BC827DRAFT_435818 [Russula dissimulans]|nr:hypothetical protein BC827DRAFT_435818 [Russula dissimulans]
MVNALREHGHFWSCLELTVTCLFATGQYGCVATRSILSIALTKKRDGRSPTVSLRSWGVSWNTTETNPSECSCPNRCAEELGNALRERRQAWALKCLGLTQTRFLLHVNTIARRLGCSGSLVRYVSRVYGNGSLVADGRAPRSKRTGLTNLAVGARMPVCGVSGLFF